MKSGFVNIFGKPNAGKSTLLNILMGEKLAIVSSKVQTTRHRIKGILTGEGYQIIFSDTPGIIDPKYKLHEKMMASVRSALEDADLALLLFDAKDNEQEANEIFTALKLKTEALVIINKTDAVKANKVEELKKFFAEKQYCKEVVAVSALKGNGIPELLQKIIAQVPEGEPFYGDEEISDLPTKFFVAEIVREKIFSLFDEEIPYHTTVIVNEFKQKSSLVKIRAEIIVQRESQKAIIIGDGGKMIKQVGSLARVEIEKFIEQKIFLELFVKVRPKWRENDLYLKEYGY
ncbi:MAG: GTPase Era [Bacteroidota bacterium]